MDEKKKKRMLDDELLDQDVGGGRVTIEDRSVSHVFSYSGPGSNYEIVNSYTNGTHVYTTGDVYHNQEDGLTWCQLDDGSWVPSNSFRG